MAQTINVDISTRGAPPVAYTHQGDTDRTFLVNVFENGAAFGVAGFTVKVAAILPSDNGYTVITGADMVSATKTNTGTNQLMFTPSAQYTARSGRGILTLIMTTNTGTPATIRPINIDFRIQKSADGDNVIAGASDFPEGLEEIAESVFQEYLSTYLPPVAPSSSAAANKAADAKLTGEALDDLKSELIGELRSLRYTIADFLTIPSYWKTTADTKANTVNTLRASIQNPFSTAFITDVHYEDNQLNSPDLMKYIMFKTGIDTSVCGGDIIVQQDSKSSAVEKMIDWLDRCESLNMAYCVGNHDLNSEENDDTSVWLTYQEWLNIFSTEHTGVTYFTHSSGDATCFGIRDHADTKIREIFINTGANSETDQHFSTSLTWAVQTKVQELSSDWGVIIYAHKFWTPGQPGTKQNPASYIQSYLAAIKEHINCEIIALVTGHCHNNHNEYDPTLGYLIMSTTCDASGRQATLDQTNPTRTAGTTLEQAFDIITIDRANKMLYTTRVGAGSDRSIRYLDQSLRSITNNLTNCTNSNSATSIQNGESYSATITPTSGYTLQDVVCTMGGTSVTVTNGVIDIVSVTGDIVITAVATKQFVNEVPISTALNGDSVYNSTGYKDGYYLSTWQAETASSGFVITGCIPYSMSLNQDASELPDIYIYGVNDAFADSHNRVAVVSSAKTAGGISNSQGVFSGFFTITTLGTNYYKLTPKSDETVGNMLQKLYSGHSIAYLRFSVKCSSGSSLVISIDSEIPSTYRS